MELKADLSASVMDFGYVARLVMLRLFFSVFLPALACQQGKSCEEEKMLWGRYWMQHT
jgi:hypothetical protein